VPWSAQGKGVVPPTPRQRLVEPAVRPRAHGISRRSRWDDPPDLLQAHPAQQGNPIARARTSKAAMHDDIVGIGGPHVSVPPSLKPSHVEPCVFLFSDARLQAKCMRNSKGVSIAQDATVTRSRGSSRIVGMACFQPNGYLLGSYRIATRPEPSSSRLTSFQVDVASIAPRTRRPVAASLGCTTKLVLIDQSQLPPYASGSLTPPTNSPLHSCCELSTAFPRSPRG